jgi:hypothetical protein
LPRWPHQYTVRTWRDDLDETFEAFEALIRTDGTSEAVASRLPRSSGPPTAVSEIEGWDYWTVSEPLDETKVINRARVSAITASRAWTRRPSVRSADLVPNRTVLVGGEVGGCRLLR